MGRGGIRNIVCMCHQHQGITMTSFAELFKVDLPECNQDGIVIEKFDTREPQWRANNLHYTLHGRGTPPGIYTMLKVDGELWMSDTRAEAMDHILFFDWCEMHKAKKILINGLGMGCIVHALLTLESVTSIDIVEIDQRVIDVIGSHYAKDPRVHLHHANAFDQTTRWPKNSKWDAAWHDIWPDLCGDNIPEMTRLQRSYGRRVTHQESWSRRFLEKIGV
jgi:hypothetical protein